MSDDFLDELNCVLGQGRGFGHREHLELAWRYVRSHDLRDAERLMRGAIRHVAVSHGQLDKYHETLTVTWLRLVDLHARTTSATSFEGFLAEHPALLDRELPSRHFSPALLSSDEARRVVVEPDLGALPAA
jgi:hypothetical protein